MRKLFLMLGSPASGKSTFIKENNLQDYTIEADAVRRIVSNPATYVGEDDSCYAIDFNGVDFRDEKYVWEVIYSALERRMSQGETTIVDATHLFKGMGEKVFSPDLALQLWEEDESIRDLYDKLESKIVNLENEARKIDIHLNTKEKQLALKDDVEIIKFDGSKEMADRYGLEINPFSYCETDVYAEFDGRIISKDDYIIVKSGKVIYVTEFPIFDIFKLTETER